MSFTSSTDKLYWLLGLACFSLYLWLENNPLHASSCVGVYLRVDANTSTSGEEYSHVRTVFCYPLSAGGPDPELPIVFVLNGFNVQSVWYSRYLSSVASRGYLTIITDLLHEEPLPYPAPAGCRNDSYVLPKAGLLTAAQTFATALEDSFWFNDPNLAALPLHLIHAVRVANWNRVVLVGHSAGGSLALQMLSGQCNPGEGRELSSLCGGYTPKLDARGADVIKGVINYEGFLPGSKVELPEGTFAALLAGEYSNLTHQAFQNMTGCSSYASLRHANHYGIVDYNHFREHQASDCGRYLPTDPPDFETTAAEQGEAIELLAHISDAFMRANVLHDPEAAEFLQSDLPAVPRMYQLELAPATLC